jgi:hypothetical protein
VTSSATPTTLPTGAAAPTSLPSATPTAPAPDAACPLVEDALQRRKDDPARGEKASVERNIALYRAIADVTSGQVSDDFTTMADLQGQYLDLIKPYGYDFRKFLTAGGGAAFGRLIDRQRGPQQRAGVFLKQTCGIDFFGSAAPG